MKMKRLLILLTLFILTGCQKTEIKTGVINDTQRLAGNKFEYSLGTIKIDDVYAEYNKLNRGDVVYIKGEKDDYYVIDYKSIDLLIDKDYVRLNSESYEAWTGYAKEGTKIYSDTDLEEKIETLKLNDEVNIVDAFDDVVVIARDNQTEAYAYASGFSKSKIVIKKVETTVVEQQQTADSYNNYSSGGSNDTGESNTPITPDPTPEPTVGEDGDAFSLSAKNKDSFIFLTDNLEEAKVLKNNVKTYICVYNQDDEVKVLSYDDSQVEVLVNGRSGYIKRVYVKLSDDTFEEYTVYTRSGVKIYQDYYRKESVKTLSLNTELKVVDMVNDMLIVEYDGNEYFIKKSDTSETKIVVKPKVVIEEKVEESSSSSSNDSGQDSGESYSTPDPEPVSEPVWTEPAL